MEKHYLNNQRGDVCDSVLTQRFEGFKKHTQRGWSEECFKGEMDHGAEGQSIDGSKDEGIKGLKEQWPIHDRPTD